MKTYSMISLVIWTACTMIILYEPVGLDMAVLRIVQIIAWLIWTTLTIKLAFQKDKKGMAEQPFEITSSPEPYGGILAVPDIYQNDTGEDIVSKPVGDKPIIILGYPESPEPGLMYWDLPPYEGNVSFGNKPRPHRTDEPDA